MAYINTVNSACANDPQPFKGLPVSYFGNFVLAAFKLTCLYDTSSDQYCIDVLFNLNSNSSGEWMLSDLSADQLCIPCVYQLMNQIQGTPFSNYDTELQTEWVSIQSTCNVTYPTDIPTPITNLSSITNFAPPNSSVTRTCLSGNYYTVAAGDTVVGISKGQSVSTGALVVMNSLFPDGSNLEAGQSLCLPQSCETYVIQPNDTCYGISQIYNITYSSLIGYNPTIDAFCINLISGQAICISPADGVWNVSVIPSVSPTQVGVYATTSVAPPGPTASGTTPYCGQYYQVQPGDQCQLVALNQIIALSLFEQINPSIDATCNNLVPGLWYCVLPEADWNSTSTSVTATFSTYVSAPTSTPTGTTADCYEWYVIQSGDYCSLIESYYDITFAELQAWNPSLDDSCSNLILNDAYCVDGSSTSVVSTTTSTTGLSSQATSTYVSAPTATPSGTTADCYEWYVVQTGDTCPQIESEYDISFAQLQAWNPSIDSTCSNIYAKEAYCVSSPVQVISVKKRRDIIQITAHPSPTAAGVPPKYPGEVPAYDLVWSSIVNGMK